ncbi:anthranilate synthase component I family protein [Paenibacillus zanthoxyli]|uniref:anthranilate synthase component I family protein n=1 Tax=Paenibacillus zanthoxyli TaxID=369399 RepID=UPI000470FBB6|nr:anthranilate synthase component I family protein [Paenibacillus zanthoxyli]
MNSIQVNTEIHDIAFLEPFEAYLGLREYFGSREVYLLESLSGPAKDAQSTLLGFKPILAITTLGSKIKLDGVHPIVERVVHEALQAGLLISEIDGMHLKSRKKLWDFFRFVQSQFSVTVPDPGQAFYFGYFGYLGYDTAWSIEDLPFEIPVNESIPDVVMSIYQGLIEFNLVENTARLIINQSPCTWDNIHCEDIINLLNRPIPINTADLDDITDSVSIDFTVNKDRYEESVRKALDYIAIGDIYQVQLGNQINIKSTIDPLIVYRRLRSRNPSPYMYLAPFGEITLVGASPEMYVKIQDRTITMRPIAGTCRRGFTLDEDEELIRQLKMDEKELAEHIMLVDLCRNDIGRICSSKSLEVEELIAVEQYSHVNHLVSSVRGEQRADKDMYDIIGATFPAGTMTGAPKVRAMEIIEELETTRRGPYAGALGFIDFNGFVNMALCIRTAVYQEPDLYAIRASAGVVADSKPENEWKETFHKMGALFWAVTGKEVLNEGDSYRCI